MRRYETIVIVDPDLSDEQREPLFQKLKDLFPQYGGFLIDFDEWGTQKLAYEIRKKVRGFYIRFDYCGDGALVSEMERSMKIDDRVLKFMTILLEKKADVDNIKSEMADKEEPAAQDKDSDVADQDIAAADQDAVEDEGETEDEPESETEDEPEGETEGEPKSRTEDEPESRAEEEPEDKPQDEPKDEAENKAVKNESNDNEEVDDNER